MIRVKVGADDSAERMLARGDAWAGLLLPEQWAKNDNQKEGVLPQASGHFLQSENPASAAGNSQKIFPLAHF